MSVAKSAISWTESTWNPIAGCEHAGEGCRHCYAERRSRRLQAMGKRGYEGVVGPGGWTGRVNLKPHALEEPLHWRRPRVIFVNSMADLYHASVPFEFVAAVYGVMAACPQHTFIVLTKRPGRRKVFFRCNAAEFSSREGWPLPNVWEGVSCWDQPSLDAMWPILQDTPAAWRLVSLEPLLAGVDLDRIRCGECGHVFAGSQSLKATKVKCPRCEHCDEHGGPVHYSPLRTVSARSFPGLDQVLVGGETGPGARPCGVEWVRSIVHQCREAGVPCHLKQLGKHISAGPTEMEEWEFWALRCADGRIYLRDPRGGEPSEWPEDLRAAHGPGSLAWGNA